MTKRIQVDELEPKAYTPLFTLEKYLAESLISKEHLHLIKIRASQINGCSFCINMHTEEALNDGESQQRIFLLNAWKNTDLYTEAEKALLQATEEITLIHLGGLSDLTYNNVLGHFNSNYVAQLIVAVCAINTWNRIAISTLKPF